MVCAECDNPLPDAYGYVAEGGKRYHWMCWVALRKALGLWKDV